MVSLLTLYCCFCMNAFGKCLNPVQMACNYVGDACKVLQVQMFVIDVLEPAKMFWNNKTSIVMRVPRCRAGECNCPLAQLERSCWLFVASTARLHKDFHFLIIIIIILILGAPYATNYRFVC